MLRYRILSGLGLTIAVVLVFWLDSRLESWTLPGAWSELFAGRATLPPGLLILLATLVIAPLAARELCAIFRANQTSATVWLTSLSAMAGATALYLTLMSGSALHAVATLASVLIGCFVLSLVWHIRGAQVQGAVSAAGATALSAIYLGLLPGFFPLMRHRHSAWLVLGVLLITKAADIGAYAAGKAAGRHKLIPWLSPGKTWEGLCGGIALSMLVAAGFAWLSGRFSDELQTPAYSPIHAALFGAVLAIVGLVGDLTMSLFKRDAGLKDSGAMLPGMGGILDVLDSPLLAGPAAFWMLELWAG